MIVQKELAQIPCNNCGAREEKMWGIDIDGNVKFALCTECMDSLAEMMRYAVDHEEDM